MNLTFSPAEESFRDEVRTFLSEALTAELKRYASRMTSVYAQKDVALEWQAILVEKGKCLPSANARGHAGSRGRPGARFTHLFELGELLTSQLHSHPCSKPVVASVGLRQALKLLQEAQALSRRGRAW
mgnify:CR=1 FL=1